VAGGNFGNLVPVDQRLHVLANLGGGLHSIWRIQPHFSNSSNTPTFSLYRVPAMERIAAQESFPLESYIRL
jgi:hypothetical protein